MDVQQRTRIITARPQNCFDAIQRVINRYWPKTFDEASLSPGTLLKHLRSTQLSGLRVAFSTKEFFRRQYMNTPTIVVIALFSTGVIVAIVVGIWLYVSSRRTKELRSKFGPEYRRVARAEGDATKAEKVLQEREERVKKLDIKVLTQEQRNEFADAWEHAQAEFVDDPTAAVAHADVLVQDVMNVRGYPVADFEQRV